jgi:hypothetical protein
MSFVYARPHPSSRPSSPSGISAILYAVPEEGKANPRARILAHPGAIASSCDGKTRKFVPAVVGDDFAVVGDDNEIDDEVGEKLNARAALFYCDRCSFANVRLPHVRIRAAA